MRLLFSDRSNLAQATLVGLATIAALALLAMIAAYWTWHWLAPRPLSPLQAPVTGAAPAQSAGSLFGKTAAQAAPVAASAVEIRLLGSVAATPGRSGYALLRLDPRQVLSVREGEEILPGLLLAAVANDYVILERGGTREILAWPTKAPGAESAAPRIRP